MSKLPKIKIIFYFLLLFYIAACSNSNVRNDDIVISVSIPPLADFAQSIVGNRANIQTLIPPGVNLHSFEPSPEIIKLIINSDIYFRIGKEMRFEEVILNKVGKEKIKKLVDISNSVKIRNNDPHIWLSPENAKIITEIMLDELIKVLPQHELYFRNNRQRYIEKLDSIDLIISNVINEKKQRIIFVYHPAWSYFAEYYGLLQISVEKDGKSPKAKDLKELTDLAKEKQISCIFFDPHFDDNSVLTIARTLNLATDSLDPIPSDYLENLIEISHKLKKHLQ